MPWSSVQQCSPVHSVHNPQQGVSSEFSVRLLDDSGPFAVQPRSGSGSSALSLRLARGPLDYENPNQRKFILLVSGPPDGNRGRGRWEWCREISQEGLFAAGL